MRSIELFTGAGGLAIGLHQAGFEHVAIAEWDRHAVKNLNLNRQLLGLAKDVPIEAIDVKEIDWRPYEGQIDLVAGGVPCQPFSLGGRHLGQDDHRNLFPQMLRAVREIRPAAVLIENVKGLLRPSFAAYFDYVLRQLEMPDLTLLEGENWLGHYSRLHSQRSAYSRGSQLRYRVRHRLIECADFGVPQQRSRVLVVAYRADLDTVWEPPRPTYSADRLLHDQWVTGSYWAEHSLPKRRVPKELKPTAEQLSGQLLAPTEQRWRTVRDALRGLEAPHRHVTEEHASVGFCLACHWGNPGARSYPGHDGSHMDWPAKTLKAGVHGVPGGENMLRNANGSIRYFTAREAARIQTFPDDYHFAGTWGEIFRQLGNAVPVSVAKLIAQQIATAILKSKSAQATEQMSLVASG